ncbi:MAG: nuclear transport factor 2 family protein [Acidobacteriota bacterium]|nr:nuclear transport factor 2 family protein [Acidobacteriota bacterium]MDH3527987.1 nuclear transport factor 2 family protein [Acidobacteriota bacterium]
MKTLTVWHEFVATQNPDLLADILAEECVFHSPVVWKPKEGRPIVTAVLTAASQVFSEFRYVREVVDDENAVLEFEAKVGELTVRGVDILKFGADGKIVDFEVMIRPANGLQAVGMGMANALMGTDV